MLPESQIRRIIPHDLHQPGPQGFIRPKPGHGAVGHYRRWFFRN